MEQRIVRYFNTEMRASDGEDMSVEGYALKFNKETIIGGSKWGFREKIAKTSLNSAQLDDVIFNFNHSMDNVLAGNRNKSLTLTVDSTGLKIAAKIIDTAVGRDVYKLVKEGLINRMSFAATVKKSEWTFVEDGSELDLREITEFERFYDVSAVTFPAYSDTLISARNGDREMRQQQIYERQIHKLNKIMGGK